MNNKGQSILSEHVMIIFVVIAAIVAMTAFVQRSLEARIHDARHYMISSLNSDVCDANCLMATGGNIADGYEPYYSIVDSNVAQNSEDFKGTTRGNAEALGVIYYRTLNEQTNSTTASAQLPPECAGAPNANCNLVQTGSVQ